jgi:pyruvate/2-oxoglutarate dehydrogenase complex dihydrolipoamide acyltransferase (E2) component
MARQVVEVPFLSEGVDAVTIVEWNVAVGDQVDEQAGIVTMEAEKVDIVLPAPVAGTVVELLVEVDDEVAVGDAVCIIETGG